MIDEKQKAIACIKMALTITCLSGPLNGMYESSPQSSAMGQSFT